MDNSSSGDNSLYNLAFNKLCQSMDKDTMQKILNDCPPIIILEVIWKILLINNGDDELLHDHSLHYTEEYEETFNEGCVITHLLINVRTKRPLWNLENRILRRQEIRHQIYFTDKFDFYEQFNPDIFFKLLSVAKSQCKVFVIFQICVQKKGIKFPKQFAEMWIEKTKTQENEININHIERGVKLGIFLGDCGWCSESALVLSYIYKLISTKWVCSDLNVKLIQSVQCLAKWLLVTTYYNDFDEATVVLSRMLCNIGLLESVGSQVDIEIQSCLVKAYFAVSEYYYEIKDYENAWFWAVKIVDKLNDEISDTLKLSVIGHFIKVCPATNRANIGKRLLEELLYSYTNEIDPKTCIDIIKNVTGYQLHANLLRFTISNYLISIGWSRYLFGYCNLYTAKLMVDYARIRYDSNFTELTDTKHAMSGVVQGIYIMEKIGIPSNNMLLINAQMIKSSILQFIFAKNLPSLLNPIEMVTTKINKFLKSIADTETCYKKSLEISIKLFGKNSPSVARCNYNMGEFYQNQFKYLGFMLNRIDLCGINALVANNVSDAEYYEKQSREMRNIQLDKLEKAKPYFLKAKEMYETTYGAEYFWLVHVYRRLTEAYYRDEDDANLKEYKNKLLSLESNIKKVDVAHTVNNKHVKDYICLEKFKRIIDDSKWRLKATVNPFSP